MRQLVYTMFIGNNRASFHLWWKESSVNHQKVSKYKYFFYQGFLHKHWRFTGQQRKGGDIFYSSLPLLPAHEHWDTYLQLCMWDDYLVFLIAALVFTRLLHDEIYHLIELLFDWLVDDARFACLLDELILGFCYNDLTLETGRFELASSITLALQANWLTKCASLKILYNWFTKT